MICGRSRLTTYENTETVNPGRISSLKVAPPTRSFFSTSSTRCPARAR